MLLVWKQLDSESHQFEFMRGRTACAGVNFMRWNFPEEMPGVFDRSCGGSFSFHRFLQCPTTLNAAGRWQNQTPFWQDSLDPAVGDGR